MPPCSAPVCWWWMKASGLLLCWQLQVGEYSVFFFFSLPVMLPSEIPKLPTDPPVRGFPAVWKLLLVHGHSPQDGSPSLTLLSFIFCPTSFRREWATFLGAWCPPPVFGSCFVEAAQHSNDLLINLWGRKWSPCHIPPPSSARREGLFKY